MQDKKTFASWDVVETLYFPEGAVLYLNGYTLVLTDFGPGAREKATCAIGNVFDIFYDEKDHLITQEEVMKEVTRIALEVEEIDSNYSEYLIDGEVYALYEMCKGLSRIEALDKVSSGYDD